MPSEMDSGFAEIIGNSLDREALAEHFPELKDWPVFSTEFSKSLETANIRLNVPSQRPPESCARPRHRTPRVTQMYSRVIDNKRVTVRYFD